MKRVNAFKQPAKITQNWIGSIQLLNRKHSRYSSPTSKIQKDFFLAWGIFIMITGLRDKL
jgi:hypothetical protein